MSSLFRDDVVGGEGRSTRRNPSSCARFDAVRDVGIEAVVMGSGAGIG